MSALLHFLFMKLKFNLSSPSACDLRLTLRPQASNFLVSSGNPDIGSPGYMHVIMALPYTVLAGK